MQGTTENFRHLIQIVAGFVESHPDELVEAVEDLWSETMALVRNRGISIENPEVVV